MNKFLNFDSFIIPKIITYVYWLFCILTVLAGLGLLISGTMQGVIAGIMTVVFGILSIRISCELVMVIFKINDNLQKMADREKE